MRSGQPSPIFPSTADGLALLGSHVSNPYRRNVAHIIRQPAIEKSGFERAEERDSEEND
jgi:hypothetical protein